MKAAIWLKLSLLGVTLVILGLGHPEYFIQAQQDQPISLSNSNASSSNLVTYVDPSNTYSLQYPAQWKVTYYEPVTRFDTPSTGFEISPTSSVSVDVMENEEQLSDDMLDLGASVLSSTYEREHPGVNVEHVDSDTYEIDGNKAVAMLSSGGLGAFMPQFSTLGSTSSSIASNLIQVKNLVLLTYPGEYGLRVQYFAPEASFENNVADVDAMIDSIQFLDQGQNQNQEEEINTDSDQSDDSSSQNIDDDDD